MKLNRRCLFFFLIVIFILKAIHHENIIEYIGVCFDPNMTLITEWCTGPDLCKYLVSEKHIYYEKSSMQELMSIGYQVSLAISYLHSLSIIHRDIKSANIFLSEIQGSKKNGREWIAKLGDFGLAISEYYGFEPANKKNKTRIVGTFNWYS